MNLDQKSTGQMTSTSLHQYGESFLLFVDLPEMLHLPPKSMKTSHYTATTTNSALLLSLMSLMLIVEVVANTTKALSHSILASSRGIAHAIFRCRHIYLRVKLISYSAAARPSDTIRGTNWVPNIYQIVLTIIPHSRTLPGYYYIG